MMSGKSWDGRARVSVGARSVCSHLFKNLGLIIIDEEHESTYKQKIIRDITLRVPNGEVDIITASHLGSATPCLESYARAEKVFIICYHCKQSEPTST